MKKIILMIFFLINNLSFCYEPTYFARSPKGLLMGDAYTSYANNNYCLFYNPALCARNYGFTFKPLNFLVTMPDLISNLDELDSYSEIGSDPSDVLNELQGQSIHAGMQFTSSIQMGNLSLAYYYSQQGTLGLTNAISPTVELNYKVDNGFIIGYGHALSGSIQENSGEQFSIGASLKYTKREGIFNDFLLFSPTFVSALAAGELKDVVDSLGNAYGHGWGVDLGLDYIKRKSTLEYAVSLALLDIVSGLKTRQTSVLGSGIREQSFMVNLGGHLRFDFADIFNFALTMDIRSLQDKNTELLSKLRLGIELGSPILSLFAGHNSGYFSYGIFTNLGIAKIYLGMYAQELGVDYKVQKSDRMLVYISLFNIKFDA